MSVRLSSEAGSEKSEMTRGQRLWAMLRDSRDTEPVSMERAKLLTASYKETEGLPIPIRRAKAFEKIVTGIPIYIDEGQLLVGDSGSRPMAPEWHPEYCVDWVVREFQRGTMMHNVAEDDAVVLREICEYWKNKAVKESFELYKGEAEIKELTEMCDEGAWIFSFFRELEFDKSWYAPDFEKVIRKGLSGILVEVEEVLRATDPLDDASRDKVYFLQAMTIVLRAGIQYGKRYATLARKLARRAKGQRKAELESIAEVCDRVPENPARSFREALQAIWLCHVLMFWDTGGSYAAALGRVDQYLFPFYKRDIEEGRITDEGVVELLECLRIKASAGRMFRSVSSLEGTTGETQFINCTLGGQTTAGDNAVNRLSYLWIEAAMRVNTAHPTLSIRWHENISADFAMKAAELNRLGLGFPAWFGDRSSIEYLLRMGATLEEARDYCLAGCVLTVVPHKTPPVWPIIISMPKVLSLTLYNGLDIMVGKKFGLETGNFEDFATFEQLCDAFKKQVRYFLTRSAKDLNQMRLFRSSLVPQVFASCLFDDCIKRGQDAAGGGCRYQQGSMFMLPIGIIDVADSLAAVRKYIYEEGLITKKELLEALRVNFEGKEELRRLLLSAPKYGNDDDYVDSLVAELYKWLCQTLDGIDACYGAKYVCAPHSISFQGMAGKRVGALPSGRLSGLAVADGGVSACQGMDVKGPTALIKSAGKIDHVPIYGTLFNMKFSPSALKTTEDLKKFLALIDTYLVDYNGKHVQFNIIDSETLLDAQKHPERYRNLVVRVAGYSALWVELTREIQDEIIKRTEHKF
jgi:pyruvate formate-lyase/glycerol dehydratase family glycyl radical enzyme